MDAAVVIGVLLVIVVASVSYWVLQDGRARAQRRRPVVVVVFGFTIDRPETWAVLCLFGSVFFIPTYLVARNVSG